MRIAIDARYLGREFTGIGHYSEHLLRHLTRLDPETRFTIFVHESYDRELDLPENAEIIPSPTRPLSLPTLFGMARKIHDTGADVFHSLFPVAPLWLHTPSIVTVHDLQALSVPGFTGRRIWPVRAAYDIFYRWIYPRTLRRARYLIAVSHATMRDIARVCPEARSNSIVIYSGLDHGAYGPVDENTRLETQQKYNLPSRFVLYIGSTRPNKNLPTMVRAFARMQERHEETRDCYFVMVVSADRFFEDARRAIKQFRLQKRMRVYQQISESEKRAFYSMASGLYFVTKNEGFGIPLLEAQCMGTPALAADHAALPEIANGSALLADPDDPIDISRQLRRLLQDKPLRQTLIEAGRRNVLRFDWDRTATSVLQMYHHLF